MKRPLQLFICCVLFFSCDFNSHKELIFLQKNAYEHPVWEEMLHQEKVKFSDVVSAFKAYASTHQLDEETLEHFEKLEKRIKQNLDSEGYYVSKLRQYKNLLAYRKATPNARKITTNYSNSTTFFTTEVPNNANYGQWKNIGPFGNPEVHWSATGNGAVQHLEMHPTNPAVMFASTRNGGLWKTINYGRNWTPETDHFATNNTSCIEVCSANPSIFYLGAAEDEKVWYSSDAGVNWEDRSSGISGDIYDIHSDPTDATRVLAATSDGIYLTTDSGANWSQKVAGRYTDIDITGNWDLIIVSNDNNNIAPILNFSKDKGDTFIEKSIITHLTEVDRFFIAIHKPTSGATQVFAYGIVDGNSPTRFIGLWKSDFDANPVDGTSYFSFTEVKHPTYGYPNGSTPLTYENNADGFKAETADFYGSVNPYSTATWISDFYVSPNNPNRMLTLREKIWGSGDGGVIWESKPSYGGSHWADNRYVTTNVAKDSVYWCNDGGMWSIKENDLFPTEAEVTASGLSKIDYMNSKVVSKNGDICVSEGSQMDVSQMNKGVFMTGGQDIGQVFTRNGRDSHVASADIYRGRIKPTDDAKFITGSLKVKLDGGTDEFSVYNNIEPDHFNSDRLYGFTRKNLTQNTNEVRLARSPSGLDGWLVNGFRGENQANLGGGSWVPTYNNWQTVSITSTGITNLKIGTFEQSRANAELAFLGDEVGEKLFYTDNLSAEIPNWVQLSNAPAATRYRIATHQYNENIIVIATNLGVYVSKDKGETWSKRGTFPETNPKAVLVDKNTSEGIYILTALTVYYIDENLTEWVEFNKGLPLQDHSDMRIAYYPNNDNRLYVSKYGRGVWSTSLQSVLDDNGDKPIAAFSIHGNSTNEIFAGEKVQLLDQSSNATGLQWTLENGTDVITINDEKTPEIVLNTSGYYKVTLVANNDNGSNTVIKENYILVNSSITLACELTSTATLPSRKGLKTVKVDNDTYTVPSRENYIDSNKIFELTVGEEAALYIEDVYTGYNFYTKAWIDYNNDGDFDDANEEIASSGGQIESFTTNFTPINTSPLGQPLRMRVSSLESATAPISCQTTGTRQSVDFLVTIKSKVTFTSLHTISSVNSAALETTFSGATNVVNAGFVYSKFDGVLTVDNSDITTYSTALANNDNYTKTIADLEFNATYYYRPFVRDQYGIYYGDKQSFQLAPYKIPSAESLTAINLGNDQWKLKGVVFPENILLDELTIEYGINDFSNSVSFNPSSHSTASSFNITTDIATTVGNTYQFRIKEVTNGETYYSNSIAFITGQTICVPTVGNNVWNRRVSNVTFNGNSNGSSGSTDYEDFTNLIYNVDGGDSYDISVTDSYSPGQNLSYLVYVDYNNDGDFNDYNETVAQGTPGTDTFTSTITIPTIDVVFDVNLRMRVIGYSTSANSCVVETGQVEDYTIKILPVNYWTGSVSSDWDLAANWSLNSVPTSTTNVVVSNLTNQPIKATNINVKKLTLDTNTALTVDGTVINNGIITINSGASFIAKTSVSGVVAYNRNLSDLWHLVSSPVSGETIENLIINNTFKVGSAPNIGLAPYDNTRVLGSVWDYQTINSTGNLSNGQGFSVLLENEGVLSFSGSMNTDNVPKAISIGARNAFNLVGNPYTSFINGNTFLGTNTARLSSQTIWVWDGLTYKAKNLTSNFKIAPGQGFFVECGVNGDVLFEEVSQSHESTDTFQREIPRTEIKLILSDLKSSKSSEIYYIDGTTTGYDNGYDSELFRGVPQPFAIYTHLVSDSQGKHFQIQSIPNSNLESMVIPVGVNTGADKEISFSVEALNLPTDVKVFLEDSEANVFTRLDEVNSKYSVNINTTLNGVGRFFIHTTKSSLGLNLVELDNLKVYKVNNNTLRISGLEKENTNIKIFTILGKEIISTSFLSEGMKEINLPRVASGVYIVQAQNGRKIIKKKFIIE